MRWKKKLAGDFWKSSSFPFFLPILWILNVIPEVGVNFLNELQAFSNPALNYFSNFVSYNFLPFELN